MIARIAVGIVLFEITVVIIGLVGFGISDSKNEKMRKENQQYKKAMEEMECWRAEQHLKECGNTMYTHFDNEIEYYEPEDKWMWRIFLALVAFVILYFGGHIIISIIK